MGLFNIVNELSIQATIRANTYDTANGADLEGTAIDISELDDKMLLVVVDAAACSSGETMDFVVQHSYDGSTNWANVPAAALVDPSTGEADTFTQNTASVAVFEKLGLKRDLLRQYVRVKGDAAGNGTPAYYVAAYILGKSKYSA